jgi:hypothetical protein
MVNNFTEDYKAIIMPIIQKHLPQTKIILYGSRVRGDFYEGYQKIKKPLSSLLLLASILYSSILLQKLDFDNKISPENGENIFKLLLVLAAGIHSYI